MDAPRELAGEVGRLIRLTAGHNVQAGDINGAWLCDSDLAVLAGDESAYAAYVADVRAEYAHVPHDQWRTGRAAVLESLLDGDRLFTLAAEWEDPARGNLLRELSGPLDARREVTLQATTFNRSMLETTVVRGAERMGVDYRLSEGKRTVVRRDFTVEFWGSAESVQSFADWLQAMREGRPPGDSAGNG